MTAEISGPQKSIARIAADDALCNAGTAPELAMSAKHNPDCARLAPLFAGWEETLIWSYLEGFMGYAIPDDAENPTAAQIVVGDFCFFAGEPNEALVAKAAAPILTPQNRAWCRVIERVWGERVHKQLRYAIRKEPDVFDIPKLTAYAAALPREYTLARMDESLYCQAKAAAWSCD